MDSTLIAPFIGSNSTGRADGFQSTATRSTNATGKKAFTPRTTTAAIRQTQKNPEPVVRGLFVSKAPAMRLGLPARLFDAGQFALERQFAECDAAQLEVPQETPWAAGDLAAVAQARLAGAAP